MDNVFYRKLFLTCVIGVIFLFSPDILFAQNQTQAFADAAGFEVARDPRGIAALLVNSVFTGLGLAFILYIVWGGYLIMTGGGKEDRIDRGKRAIWTSTIGVIVLISSYGITRFVILLVDFGANQQPNVINDDSGFSIDIQTTDNNNRPADPLFDPNATGHENDLVDPDFYR